MTATASDLFAPPPVPPSSFTVGVTPPDGDDDGPEPMPTPAPTPPSGPPGWLSEVIDAHAQAHGGAARRLSQAAANIPADADPDDLTRLWSLVWPDRDPGQLWGSAASKELASRAGHLGREVSDADGRILDRIFPLLKNAVGERRAVAGLIDLERLSKTTSIGEAVFRDRVGKFMTAFYDELPAEVLAVVPPAEAAPKDPVGRPVLVFGPSTGGRPAWTRASVACDFTAAIGRQQRQHQADDEKRKAETEARRRREREESQAPDALRADLREMRKAMAEQAQEIAALKAEKAS